MKRCFVILAVALSLVLARVADAQNFSIDGEWSGTTSQGKKIDFSTKDNGLWAISVDFVFNFGSCTLSGPASRRNFQTPIVVIAENKFSVSVSQRISVTGMFTSDTTASGTIRAEVNVPGCQGQAETSWRARKTISTGVQARDEVPRQFSLSQNYPNPFNPSTIIVYTLPQPSHVELKVYDLHGREVQVSVIGRKEAGKYSIELNAISWPSGVYFYQLRAGNFVATKKLILLK
ncbi:T9SS type A sorting domain-containing protein [candidate division KSB1 bacterium]|nr:T9SS type A sorting domain-containing protein [candidate division KSB1 bacterium]